MSMAPTTSASASRSMPAGYEGAGTLSSAGGSQDPRQDDAGREDLFGERPGRVRRRGIVGLDGADGRDGIVERREEAEAWAGTQVRLRTGRFHHAGPAARQVTDRA